MLLAPSRISARAPSPCACEPADGAGCSQHGQSANDRARFDRPAQEQNSKKMATAAKDRESVAKSDMKTPSLS
jgi:hypothetical protein